MVWFEVVIPGKDANRSPVTFTLEAANWLGALRAGLANLGEGQDAVAGIQCDVRDDQSIHVTHMESRRVFRLREVAPPSPTSSSTSKAPPPKTTEPEIETTTEATTEATTAITTTLRVDDAIAAIFDATQPLLARPQLTAEEVANALLDLALAQLPAEAGSFYLADMNGQDLQFAAVRGPKAEAIRRSRMSVPIGKGVIGFCAREGVCLLVRDMQKDPRHFSALAEAIGDKPRDTLCAVAEREGRLYGAIQLINLKGLGGFGPAHLEVLRYIGLTAAELLERVANRD